MKPKKSEFDRFIKRMEKTLDTYRILLEDEKTRQHVKGFPEPNTSYFEGCIHVLMSLLFSAADIKRKEDMKLAEEILAKKEAEKNVTDSTVI